MPTCMVPLIQSPELIFRIPTHPSFLPSHPMRSRPARLGPPYRRRLLRRRSGSNPRSPPGRCTRTRRTFRVPPGRVTTLGRPPTLPWTWTAGHDGPLRDRPTSGSVSVVEDGPGAIERLICSRSSTISRSCESGPKRSKDSQYRSDPGQCFPLARRSILNPFARNHPTTILDDALQPSPLS